MKKLLFGLGLIAVALTLIFAAATNTTQNGFLFDLTKFDGTINSYQKVGGGSLDTLVVNDTVTYILRVEKGDDVTLYGQIYLDKIGAGKPTVTAYFYQSNDGVNYETLKKGINRVAYTVANSGNLSSDSTVFFSFKKDTVYFEGRFLKIVERTSNTANTSVKVTNYLKFNRK